MERAQREEEEWNHELQEPGTGISKREPQDLVPEFEPSGIDDDVAVTQETDSDPELCQISVNAGDQFDDIPLASCREEIFGAEIANRVESE